MNFLDFRDKETVRGTRFKLKRPISLQEDFQEAIRKARSSLMPELTELRNQGKRVTLAYPAKLIADGRVVREANVVKFAR